MVALLLILFGVVMLTVGFGSAVKKPLKQSSRDDGFGMSDLEAWKCLEKRFGMERAREIMEEERWRYREWNKDMKCLKRGSGIYNLNNRRSGNFPAFVLRY